ncbi:MAG: DNA methyltransferase [Dehalococcoidia bacterium]
MITTNGLKIISNHFSIKEILTGTGLKNGLNTIQKISLWDFPTQNYGDKPHGDNKYSGVTPAFIIWNLIQRYTKEGDLVIDPMCGSGTTTIRIILATSLVKTLYFLKNWRKS